MTPTLAESRATLAALLEPHLDGVDAVYDHEPHTETSGPCYVTVELEGLTSTDQLWAVRVYSQTADSPEDAASTLDVALGSVDDRLAESTFGPSEWQVGYEDNVSAVVAKAVLRLPRESF